MLLLLAVASQEAQRENAFLRAQFSERTDCVALEKAEAERRLGAVEAETRRLTESLKEACERHAEEMKKQEERVCAYLMSFPNTNVATKRLKHNCNLSFFCIKHSFAIVLLQLFKVDYIKIILLLLKPKSHQRHLTLE